MLIAATLYHLIHLAVNREDRLFLKAMVPQWKDVTDPLRVASYNLGLTPIEPRLRKFTYAEKLEYWAFLWGMALMTASGFLLWFNSFTLHHFPKWFLDVATAVHYYEALLATFSVLLWHFYMVIFDPLAYPTDKEWLNGQLPADDSGQSPPDHFRALELSQLVETPTASADQGTAPPVVEADKPSESGPTESGPTE